MTRNMNGQKALQSTRYETLGSTAGHTVTRGLNQRLQRRSKQKAILSTWGPKETVSRCRMIHLREQEVVGWDFVFVTVRQDGQQKTS